MSLKTYRLLLRSISKLNQKFPPQAVRKIRNNTRLLFELNRNVRDVNELTNLRQEALRGLVGNSWVQRAEMIPRSWIHQKACKPTTTYIEFVASKERGEMTISSPVKESPPTAIDQRGKIWFHPHQVSILHRFDPRKRLVLQQFCSLQARRDWWFPFGTHSLWWSLIPSRISKHQCDTNEMIQSGRWIDWRLRERNERWNLLPEK